MIGVFQILEAVSLKKYAELFVLFQMVAPGAVGSSHGGPVLSLK